MTRLRAEPLLLTLVDGLLVFELFFTSTSSVFKELLWTHAGSNRRPPECKSGALPAELWAHHLTRGPEWT